MKFTCKTQNLKEAVFKVERIVSKQTTLPILGNILIKAKKGRLMLASTNLEIAIQVFVGAKIEKEGVITVPARILGGFLGTISDEVISGELNGAELKVISKKHKIKIKGIDAKDFPIIPEIPREQFFKLKTAEFSRAIGGVLVSVAHNDTRQELNGVYMEFGERILTLASTDSFRLTETKVVLESGSASDDFKIFKEKNPSVIVPALAFMELSRLEENGELSVVINQNQLFVSTESVRVISRIINGNYPEYKQVLPKKYEIVAKLEKEKLLNAVKIASLVANNQSGEVRLKNSKNNKSLVVTAQSIDAGDNVSRVPAEISGPQFEVFFNHRYLIEGLNSPLFETDELIIKLNQQKSPVMFAEGKDGKENKNFSFVIMPIIKS